MGKNTNALLEIQITEILVRLSNKTPAFSPVY